jgi:dihydrofolate reductase
MGRDTWLSIPEKYKPLKGRDNIVVTSTMDRRHFPDGVAVAPSLDQAISIAKKYAGENNSIDKKIFLIGGQGIYQEAIERNIANTILATIIHDPTGPECDRFFPEIKNFSVMKQGKIGKDPTTEYSMQFCMFKNNKNPYPLGSG